MSPLAAALSLWAAAGAPSAGYQLFPVRGVFFPPDEGRSHIDADFRTALKGVEPGSFAARFRQRFPQAATTISEKTQRRTFAVSLQVARASRYTVNKIDGTTDVYLPVTASLYFTNVMTGEVLFAVTRTTIKAASVRPADATAGSERVVALFGESFQSVVDDLIADAGQRFSPTVIEATVRARWNGLALVNRGTAEGLATGDALTDREGNELEVRFSGEHASVAAVTLGTFKEGDSFAKVTNRTLADFKKPRALVLVESVPASIPEELAVQLFSDALGAAPLSLVPVNRTFAAVLQSVGTQIDLSQEKLTQRELPSLFVRLHVPEPIVFERATNADYRTLRVTEALAFAEVVDRSGRVLYAGQGRDRIEDEITAGMALNVEARREIAVKNALLALARKLTTDFKPVAAQLQVIAGSPAAAVADPNGWLSLGETVHALRKLPAIEGLDGPLFAPTWELQVGVTEDTTPVSILVPLFAGAPPLEKGDVVQVEATGGGSSRRSLGPCGPEDRLGELEVPGYGALAYNLFASGSRAPFHTAGLPEAVTRILREGAGFKAALHLSEPRVDACIQPAYKIGGREQHCDERSCADTVNVKVGFRLRAGSAAPRSFALDTRMTSTALPPGTAEPVRMQCLTADLVDEILKLGPAAAAGLTKDKP